MSKQWVRQQVRHDELHVVIDKAILWAAANRQKTVTAVGIVVAMVLVASLAAYHARSTRADAWERLGLAQNLAYGGRADAAAEQRKKLEAEHPATDAAGFGAVFAGDLHYQKGQYKEASEKYATVLEQGLPKTLQPVALSALALSQEAAGQYQTAVQTAQRLLEGYPEHFLAPQTHACLARSLQASGHADQAKAAYQKIALQYPDTAWAAWAQSRLKSS